MGDDDYARRYAIPPEAEAWRLRARAFAADVVAPLSRDMDRDGRLRRDLVSRLGESGLLGAPLPRAAGGGGASALANALISEEMGRVDGSVRGFLAVQTSLVAHSVALEAAPAARERWAARLARGEAIGCFALTEPEAGSDVAALSTRVEPDGDGVRLSGEKHWITNGLTADVAIVFATRAPGRRDGIEAWLVPTDVPGFRREPLPGRELGHRAADHARIVLEGVRVPSGNRVGPERGGFGVAMRALERGRLSVAAGAVGIQAACLDACVAFARTRRQFGARIGDFQQVGAALADLRVALEASRLLAHHAARRADRGEEGAGVDASTAKLFATEAALSAATRAVRLHGARGYSDALPLERHYRDAVALTVYEGTSEIQRLILSRDLLGKDDAATPVAPEPARAPTGGSAR